MNSSSLRLATLFRLCNLIRFTEFVRMDRYLCSTDESLEDFLRWGCVSEFPILEDLRSKIKAIEFWPKVIEAQIELHLSRGAQILYPGHSDYPRALLQMSTPPVWLSFQGSPSVLNSVSLSVVGSREPSAQSSRWLEVHLSDFLDLHPTTIVSGGARGVDQISHHLALQKGSSTLVILPSGLSRLYPRVLSDWREMIVSMGGGFLSEYFLNVEMRKFHFIERNRLIAGFSPVTLVVQAQARSGTLLTAVHARENGRSVAVIPGHPQDLLYAGSNQLLMDGASMVRDSKDLLALYSCVFVRE